MSDLGLPGHDLIEQGVADLDRGVASVPALLVSIGAPRLRSLGFTLPPALPDPEHRLYAVLQSSDPDSAHARYNALIRQLVRSERAGRMRAFADVDRIRRFMRGLSVEADTRARVYFTGGATAVLMGWRARTAGVDIKLVPEIDRLLRAIPALKESLQINVELASPADFIPVPAGWEDRSPFLDQVHHVSFHHFDLYAQALAKIERGHTQDRADVDEMLRRGLIESARALRYFETIEPELYRYPALDPASFRRAVEDVVRL